MLTSANCGRGSAIRARPSSVDLEPVADRDGHHGDAVDEGEAGEADARGEPEVAARGREGTARAAFRSAIGSALGFAPGSSAWISGYVAELRQVRRDDQAAVDADAAAEAGDEERGRAADRPVDRAEDEERGDGCPAARSGRSRRTPRARTTPNRPISMPT